MTNRLAMMCFTVLMIVVSTSPISAQTNTAPRAQTKQPAADPKVQMATWNATTGGIMGITKEEFDSMGLGKITDTEYMAFISWVGRRQQTVIKEAVSSRLTYYCGRISLDAHDYEKVNIFLKISDPTPSELASRIRQNLRAINDVQIVYSAHEADLIVEILGFELSTTTNQKTGYAASIMTADPCTSTIGGQQADFATFRNMFLHTDGTDVSQLAESITRSLDAKDIESARESNTQMKEMLTNIKK